MENHSSNSPKHGRIGWCGLFWSMTGLLAASGVAYALGYELVWNILSLMAVVVIFIFSFVSCLPEKGIMTPDGDTSGTVWHQYLSVISLCLTLPVWRFWAC